MAVSTGSRFFGHYYIQVMPALAMLSAAGIFKLFATDQFRLFAKVLLVIGIIVTLTHHPMWRYWDDAAPPKGISAESLDGRGLEVELAGFARQNSTPGQTIFVWGYCPQLYFHSDRLPAARDYLCHYVTGYSAGSTSPRDNARSDAEKMMLDDLRSRKPQLIFDLSFLEYNPYSFTNYPLTNYPLLAEYVVANYKPAAQIGSVAIYSLITDIH